MPLRTHNGYQKSALGRAQEPQRSGQYKPPEFSLQEHGKRSYSPADSAVCTGYVQSVGGLKRPLRLAKLDFGLMDRALHCVAPRAPWAYLARLRAFVESCADRTWRALRLLCNSSILAVVSRTTRGCQTRVEAMLMAEEVFGRLKRDINSGVPSSTFPLPIRTNHR